jgi:prepilin-type N-terminal cleavage/methylation domain-containing protein
MNITRQSICCNTAKRSRGFTLYELLIVIMLFTLVGLMFSRLVPPVMRTIRGSESEQSTSARFDTAIDAMRRDVWQSTAIEAGPDHLLVTRPDHKQVRWSVGPDRHLLRVEPSSPPHDWGFIPGSIQFRREGAAARVIIADAPHFHGGEFSIVCPVLMQETK